MPLRDLVDLVESPAVLARVHDRSLGPVELHDSELLPAARGTDQNHGLCPLQMCVQPTLRNTRAAITC